MLNPQQLTEALAYQSFKAMQFENIAAQLEQHCKQLVDELGLLKKQNEEQQQLLQRPDQNGDLRDEIDTLKEANANLARDLLRTEKALFAIANGQETPGAFAQTALNGVRFPQLHPLPE